MWNGDFSSDDDDDDDGDGEGNNDHDKDFHDKDNLFCIVAIISTLELMCFVVFRFSRLLSL